MSDRKPLKPGTDGVPVQVYGQVQGTHYCPTIDTDDEYRIKLIAWNELAKLILGGKTIGGDGQQDIVTRAILTAATSGFRSGQSVSLGIDIQPLQGGLYYATENNILVLSGLSQAERNSLKIDPKSITISLYLEVDDTLEMLSPNNDTLNAAIELSEGNLNQVSFSGLDVQGSYVAAISFKLIER